MKRLISILLICILTLSLASCYKHDAVSDEIKAYEITSEIHSLYISINAADFEIKKADKLSVESNLMYLEVSEENGVLALVDKAKPHSNYSDAALTLYIPSGTVFKDVTVMTGAAKMTVDTLSASSLKLELGAGDISFDMLNAYSDIDIEGGAGQITVAGGSLNDLTLEMGAGELNLTAALLGDSELNFGVGEANLTLIGTRDDYAIDIDKGVGSITVDGSSVADFGSSGNGQNRIEIDGGVGNINLVFKDK